MIFLFPRWDVLVAWRVADFFTKKIWRGKKDDLDDLMGIIFKEGMASTTQL